MFANIFASQLAFDVTFNHVLSFRSKRERPLVLINPEGNAGLDRLNQQLIMRLIPRGLARRRDFKRIPHITLLYDDLNVPEQPIRPVSWTVREVALVLSHVGETKYDRIATWKLGS